MRWRNQHRRLIHKFLFFPVTIGGETRWWELAGIVQEWEPHPWACWVNVDWFD